VQEEAAMARRANNNASPPALDGAAVRLTDNSDGTLQLSHGAKTFKSVRLRIGRPLYRPNEFASILDRKGTEVATIINLGALPAPSRRVLMAHHDRYDLTSIIYRIDSLSHMYGSSFWDVETDKGHRQFVIRGTTTHVRWLEDTRVLITDVRGNRFEIPDLNAIDKRSQYLFHLIL
jgi:hypothetical protein